MNKLIIEINM